MSEKEKKRKLFFEHGIELDPAFHELGDVLRFFRMPLPENCNPNDERFYEMLYHIFHLMDIKEKRINERIHAIMVNLDKFLEGYNSNNAENKIKMNQFRNFMEEMRDEIKGIRAKEEK